MGKRSFFADFPFWVQSRNHLMFTKKPYDKAFDVCVLTLEMIGTRVIYSKRDQGRIFVYKGWSFLSDGETISVSITQSEGDSGCSVCITSESAFPKITDLGVNQRNLNKFERFFRAIEQNIGE